MILLTAIMTALILLNSIFIGMFAYDYKVYRDTVALVFIGILLVVHIISVLSLLYLWEVI